MRALTLITALGALQGALLLLFIAFRQRHPRTTPLALLLLVFSLRLATIPTWNPATLLALPWIYPLTAPLPFLFGFLLWWYARELGSDGSGKPGKLFLHFLPWGLEAAAVGITILVLDSAEYRLLIDSIFSGNPPLWLPIRNSLKVVLNAVYIVLAGRIAFGKSANRLSTVRRTWLRSLTLVPFIVLCFFAYVAVFPGATARLAGGSSAPFLALATAMAILIYSISFLLLVAPEVSLHRKAESGKGVEPLCLGEECEYLAGRVEDRFTAGAYLDPDLTLRDLASQLKVNPNRLSFAINQVTGKPFRSLLNSRRLLYFQDNLVEGNEKGRSILDMAFDAGFPSKSTFNRVFKEAFGMPPTEYLTTEMGLPEE